MIKNITTLKDVAEFAKQIIEEGVSFHPDDDFKEYVFSKNNKPCYSDQQAELRNGLMNQCFKVCKKEKGDIYSLMLKVSLLETGMDKFIPLPSLNTVIR